MAEPAAEPPSPTPPSGGTVASGPLAGLLRVSGLTVASRVLGLVRDAAMAAAFGNGPVLDAFTVAFRLPNVTRRLFGEAAFSTAFLPVFVREQHAAGRDAAWALATAVLVVTAAAVSAVTLAAEALLLVLWLAAGPGETRLLFGLTAALFPYQVFVCVAAQAAAVLHAFGRFSLPALLPIVGNAVWLTVLAVALRAFETDVARVYAVSCGVVLAGATQCALTLPALGRLGYRFRWDWPAARPRVREVAVAVLPVLAGLSVTELNGLIDGLFAWLLTAPADAVSPDPFRYPLEPGTAA
ncbi:MAG TPA: lipid II flippase MurJ, partial [Planctomycetaceae bacterium]